MRELSLFVGCFASVSSATIIDGRAVDGVQARQVINSTVLSPIVDLGYGVYQGYYNITSKLNIFKGYPYE
jgi:hypothetical protein